MIIKKQYLPKRFRNDKLRASASSAVTVSGVSTTSGSNAAPISPENIEHKKLKGVKSIFSEELTENDNDLHIPFSAVDILKSLAGGEFIVKENDENEPTDGNVFSALRTLLEIAENNEYLKTLFLRKDLDDVAAGLIKFVQGVEIGEFTTGALGGGGAFKMNNGISELEVDKLTVRMIATFFELVISKISHIGGQLILSPARMKVTEVEDEGSYYRCYFKKGENNEVANEFAVNDQARCQVFSGSGMKFYWRLVTSVGKDWIDLSKTDCVAGSAIPAVGDDIVQLGNRTNTNRQSAQILSTVGDDAPSWKQYGGINSFSLEGKELTVFSSKGNTIYGRTVFKNSDGNYEDIADWVESTENKIDNTQVGAKNLLREYDARFEFLYWGEGGQSGTVDLENIDLETIYVLGDREVLIKDENNYLFEVI